MISGNGAFLLTGYNVMSQEDRDKFDSRKTSRFVGVFLGIPGTIMLLLYAIGISVELGGILWKAYVAYFIIFVIWYNMKHMNKKED